jgi:hypothetical protein
VRQLNCTESAEVHTSGGSVSIGNVDNSCSIATSGGSIQVGVLRARRAGQRSKQQRIRWIAGGGGSC